MSTFLKSVIFGNSLLSLVLLISAAPNVRADTVDGSSVVCDPSSCYAPASGFGPGWVSSAIGAYCLDSNSQHSGFITSDSGIYGDLSGIYYVGTASSGWSSSGVSSTGSMYDTETYNSAYVNVAAGCDGSSSGYMEDDTYVDSFYQDATANGDATYEAIL